MGEAVWVRLQGFRVVQLLALEMGPFDCLLRRCCQLNLEWSHWILEVSLGLNQLNLELSQFLLELHLMLLE